MLRYVRYELQKPVYLARNTFFSVSSWLAGEQQYQRGSKMTDTIDTKRSDSLLDLLLLNVMSRFCKDDSHYMPIRHDRSAEWTLKSHLIAVRVKCMFTIYRSCANIDSNGTPGIVQSRSKNSKSSQVFSPLTANDSDIRRRIRQRPVVLTKASPLRLTQSLPSILTNRTTTRILISSQSHPSPHPSHSNPKSPFPSPNIQPPLLPSSTTTLSIHHFTLPNTPSVGPANLERLPVRNEVFHTWK